MTTQTASFRTKAVRVLVGLGVSASAIGLVVSPPAAAVVGPIPPLSLPFAESMTGPALQGPDWLLSGSAVLTGTASEPGMMLLTPASGGLGSAILDIPIDTSEAFTVDFDYLINGDADGMSMFLIDGTETSPTAGGGGGALGYVGAPSGYVGIGFNEYVWASGGPGIRLLGSGSGATGFNQIEFKSQGLLGTSVATNSGHARALFDRGVLTVDIESGRVFDHVDLTAVAGQAALPSTVKLGFAGATGGLVATHGIRNVSIDRQSDTLRIAPSATVNSQTGSFTVSADLINLGPDAMPDAQLEISTTGTAVPGTDWTCTPFASATCPVATTGPIGGISLPASDGQVTVTQQGTGATQDGSVRFLMSSPTDLTRRRTEVLRLSYPSLGVYGSAVPKNSSANAIQVYGLPTGWVIESPLAENGTVTVSTDGSSLLYTPDADYLGTDLVTFSVRKGDILATNYTTEMNVLNNAKPTATWATPPSVLHGNTIEIPLTLSDVDLNEVTLDDWWTKRGCVTAKGALLTYDPSCGGEGGFVGTDTVFFTIWDGNYFVDYQFDVEVTDPAPPTATFTAPTKGIAHGTTIDIPLTLADADGDTVSIQSASTSEMCVDWSGSVLTYDSTCGGDWNGFTGTDTVSFSVTDGAMSVDLQFDIEVLGPTATTKAATVQEGKSVTIPVTLSDASSDHALTLVDPNSVLRPLRNLVLKPVASNGTYTINGDNLVYTPNEGFVGADVIRYTVTDDFGIANNRYPYSYDFTAAVTVTANHAPTASAVAASVRTGYSVTVPVTLADTDNDAVTLNSATALHGGVVIGKSGLVYTPTAGYVGPDEISFSFSDYLAVSKSAVAVTVRPNNAPKPPATEDAAPKISGKPGDDFSLVIDGVTDADGDTLSIEVTTSPAHGTVSLTGAAPKAAGLQALATTGVNGVHVVYTPNAGFVGADSFTYQVSDGNGGSYRRTVAVDVLAAPVATKPSLLKSLPVSSRLLDTRSAGGRVTETKVTVNSPQDGAALNITVVGQTSPGFATVWPCDKPRPNTSNVNFGVGTAVANAVNIAPAADGTVCVFSSTPAYLIVDQSGSWSTAGGFVGQTPDRMIDTRNKGGKVTTVEVPGFDITKATFVNITVIDPKDAGFVTVWPCASPKPDSSNVNFQSGETRAAAALVKPDANGKVCMYSSSPAHLLMDRTGSLPAERVDTSHAGRLLDTRNAAARMKAGATNLLPASNSIRYINVTAVDTTGAGFATIYGDTSPKPTTSNVNYGANLPSSNTTAIGAGNGIASYASTDWRVIVDLQAEIS